MRIQPDGEEAVREQAVVVQLLRTVLRNVGSHLSLDEPLARLVPDCASSPAEREATPALDLCYPGSVAAAYNVQEVRRAATPCPDQQRRLEARLQEVAARARSSAQRAQACACPVWRVDLAPPEPHLHDSLVRAIAQIPKTPERAADLMKMTVGDWQDEQRAAFCAASCLLASVWPAMLAEAATVVRQVALLQGYGIDGFTDFTTHGAVFINQRRLEPGTDDLPPDVRFAEALVHEATHNRCNAAAVSNPFLEDSEKGSQPLVMTPLRSDPRPLTGLFQQLVVLARSLILYDQLMDHSLLDKEPLQARRERLFEQALRALETTQHHSDKLTEHGRRVVTEAEHLLEQKPAMPQIIQFAFSCLLR